MALTKGVIGRRTIDITGEQYGDLLVTGYYGKDQHGHPVFNTVCSCGNEQILSSNTLRSGKTKSCGCKQNMPIHGMAKTPEYRAYIDAKGRCENSNNQKYPWYGARGIQFKFDSFDEFIDDVGQRPSPKHSIDRIDNEGHYEIGNLRWATKSEQIHNRRQYDKPWLIGNTHAAKSA